MLGHRALLKLLLGAALCAAFVLALMSAPGFLSNLDSTSPNVPPHLEAVR